MKKNAPIDGADKHWPCADRRIVNMIEALCVRLRAGYDLHAALQLNEQDVYAGSGFVAVGAIVDDAGNRSGVRGGGREQ